MTNYISDKYKEALEQLNTEIEKQQLKMNSCKDYTEEYRGFLREQIILQEEKLALVQQEAKSLKIKIDNGGM